MNILGYNWFELLNIPKIEWTQHMQNAYGLGCFVWFLVAIFGLILLIFIGAFCYAAISISVKEYKIKKSKKVKIIDDEQTN